MRREQTGRALMGLTMVAGVLAGAMAVLALYRLRDDPVSSLGEAYRIAAFLQPVPYLAAAVLAVRLRHRPAIVAFILAAVAACGGFGWWWLSALAEVRRIENEPVRRHALGNILPDAEGEFGAVVAFLWPAVVAAVVGGLALIGWAAARPARLRRSMKPATATE